MQAVMGMGMNSETPSQSLHSSKIKGSNMIGQSPSQTNISGLSKESK